MNSLESILLFCERPAVQGALHRLQRAGADFPVVPPLGGRSWTFFRSVRWNPKLKPQSKCHEVQL